MKKTVVLVGSGVVSIPPRAGGATELIIYEISRKMPKDMLSVYVFDRKESHNKRNEIIDGAFYIRYKVPKFGNVFVLRLTEFIFGMRALKKIREISGRTRVDIVHAHTVFSSLPFALLKWLVPGKAKLIYTCHNPAWTAEDRMDFLNGIIMKIEGYVMRRFDFVTTVSDTMKESIIKKGRIEGRKIKTIYNFVDTNTFSPKHGSSWKDENGVKGPMVIFVGKLIPNKGVEYLLRAARTAADSHPDIKFVLCGPVSFEHKGRNRWLDMVKKLGLERNVIFTGGLGKEELPRAYAAADIFCLPTLRESFGMVIVEAMASGLPVITTDLRVLREVTGGSGILVEPKNSREIAEKIIMLVENPRTRKKLQKASLKRSKSFEMKKIMDEYKKFYRGIN